MNSADRTGSQDLDLRTLVKPLVFIAFVLALPFGMGTSPAIFRDGDSGWQIAAGEWILRNHAIPVTDPFSFTAAGKPWVAMEWLAETIFGAAFRLGGYAAVAAVVAAAIIALHAIIYFYLETRSPSWLIVTTFVMMDLVLARFMLARPHVLAWPLLALWTVLLLRAAENGRPPPLWSVLILVVWTNLHASFPVALLIAGAIGLDALIAERWSTLREWALFGVACLIAVSLNANGMAGLLQPFRTSSLAMLSVIGEWSRTTPRDSPIFLAILLVSVAALFWSRTRVPIGRLLLLLLLVAMAFAHVRHQSLLAVVAACVLPPLLRPHQSATRLPAWLLAGAIPLLAFRAFTPLLLPNVQANPGNAIAAVPPELRGQPLFNTYEFGGPLILAGIRPYIDGRAEIYGDAFVSDYVKITTGDGNSFNRAVDRYGISWAMISATDKPLISAIEASGKWRRIYSDRVAILEVRKGSRPSQ